MRLPHPIVLLGGAVVLAALLTWMLPAGQYDRRDDAATGRRVVVAGTYHPVSAAPVGPFAAAVSVPRGFIAGADIIVLVLLAGGAWVIVDRLGTLPAVVGWLVNAFADRGLWVIPIVSVFFGTMGALENMWEEIIPLAPALMALGAGIRVDGITVVAMSMGAAAIGAAFGPTNPFQAGIALKLAELPPLGRGGLRLAMLVVAIAVWSVLTVAHAARHRTEASAAATAHPAISAKHLLIFAIVLTPLAAYVYGSLRLDWGLNELSAGFLLSGLAAGLIGGFGLTKTVTTYVEGMTSVLMAAFVIGLARSISVVLEDGRVVDTILHAFVTPLEHVPAFVSVVLMIPLHTLIDISVPSVSGHAVLTMPLFAPVADLLHYSREAVVIAYQTGAGLFVLANPTDGGLMAVLLACGVPFQRWVRFSAVGFAILVAVGAVAAWLAM